MKWLAPCASERHIAPMSPLVLHPSCAPGPARAITATISPTPSGCEAVFRLTGEIGAIVVPPSKPCERRDNLWQTTCFEIFWQPLDGAAYREFNLSPSGQWAAYDFDAFRQGMRDAAVGSIAVACRHDGEALVLTASIASDLLCPARIALNAVVENADGSKQFWALAFPEGQPEFHAEANRTLLVN